MSVIQQLGIHQNSSMIIGLYSMTSTPGHKQEIAAREWLWTRRLGKIKLVENGLSCPGPEATLKSNP
jgi:hypothetical protein